LTSWHYGKIQTMAGQ